MRAQHNQTDPELAPLPRFRRCPSAWGFASEYMIFVSRRLFLSSTF